MVNHTYDFIDPITGTYTNHIENVWETSPETTIWHSLGLSFSLAEFMWMQRFGHSFHDISSVRTL